MSTATPLKLPSLDEVSPYATTAAVIQAKLQALSYDTNPRNLEGPFYGVHNQILTELAEGHLVTTPQYILDVSRETAFRTVCELIVEAFAKEDEEEQAARGTADDPTTQSAGRVHRRAPSIPDRRAAEQSSGNDRADVVQSLNRAAAGAGASGENTDIPDRRLSISSMHTEPLPNALTGVPDAAWTFSTAIALEGQPTTVPPEKRKIKPLPKERQARGTSHKAGAVAGATQSAPAPETAQEAAERRFAQAFNLYGGELLVWKSIFLLEEDKRNPTRGMHWGPTVNLNDPELELLLGRAKDNLHVYLFVLFHLVDKKLPSVVVRATAGVFWQWAHITRDQLPLYTMLSLNSDFKMALGIKSEAKKVNKLMEQWSEIYVVGTTRSDNALTEMRECVFVNISKYSPVAHESGKLVFNGM
ncbi:hypothetical protein GGG16DRAFT_116246 [Schizophyllum commune]|nr:hypothetical protein K525DRAFT_273793 [Schizophyllum commune Loenen D]